MTLILQDMEEQTHDIIRTNISCISCVCVMCVGISYQVITEKKAIMRLLAYVGDSWFVSTHQTFT
ncbi:hypothetical protein Hanom_Chr14g01302131 [Helianthus anomalus]